MYIIYLFLFLLGIVFGSFLNVCIIRYQNKESITRGRSHCMTCRHQLGPLDMVPLFSWIFLRGKCRYCKAPISPRYPIVEALTGLAFMLIFYKYQFTIYTPVYIVASLFLIVAAFIDIDIMIIPDRTHVALIICALIITYFHPENINSQLIGAICVSLPLLAVAYITKGIGYGDVKLMFSAGLLFGYKAIIFIFVVGAILGSIYGIYQMRVKKIDGKSEMSLGPHLILAIYIYIAIGNQLINWYLGSFFS